MCSALRALHTRIMLITGVVLLVAGVLGAAACCEPRQTSQGGCLMPVCTGDLVAGQARWNWPHVRAPSPSICHLVHSPVRLDKQSRHHLLSSLATVLHSHQLHRVIGQYV